MKHSITKLPKGALEIRVELMPDEVQPYLEESATRLSQSTKIPGFRPGRASYAEVEKRVGAMKILEEALEQIVRRTYVEILLAEKLETLGAPSVSVQKMAPGNPLEFTLTVNLLPGVTKLADYKSLRVEKKPVTVTDAEVERVVRDLQKMRAAEVRSTKPAGATDHVVLDLVISKDGTPIEGGVAKDHHVLMDEPYYIPGLTDELRGLKEGDEKSFTLSFPAEHYQKMLAGKPAQFSVKMKEIYERAIPTLDDAFAKSIGKPTMDEVRSQIRINLLEEKTAAENERVERALLDQIIAGSQFEDIPDLLVNEEINRMRQELEASVASRGFEWAKYLEHIKKTEAQLKLDFAPQALRRIKATLAIREIVNRENIAASDEEINQELDRAAALYADDKDAREHIYSPAYRDQTSMVLRNRKAMERLKELNVK